MTNQKKISLILTSYEHVKKNVTRQNNFHTDIQAWTAAFCK